MISFHAAARPLFLGSGLQVREVRLSARGSWSLLLSDGTEVEVGRSDAQHRLQRFSRLLPRLPAGRRAPARARRPPLHQRLRAGLGSDAPAGIHLQHAGNP